MPLWISVAALGLTAYSSYQQYDAAKDAAKEREKQVEEEKKRANIQNIKGMREQIRAQRMAAAQIENASALAGTSTSSGAQGGIAGTQADLAGNIAYTNQMTTINNAIGQYEINASRANVRGAMWGAIGGLSGTVFQGVGGFKPMMSGTPPAGGGGTPKQSGGKS